MLLLRISFPLHLSSSRSLYSQQPSFTSSSFLHLSSSGLFYLHSKNSFHLRQTKRSIAFPSVAIKMRMGGKKNKGRETERKRKTGREHRAREKEREKEGGSQSLNMSWGEAMFEFLLPWWSLLEACALPSPIFLLHKNRDNLNVYSTMLSIWQERWLLTSACMKYVGHCSRGRLALRAKGKEILWCFGGKKDMEI